MRVPGGAGCAVVYLRDGRGIRKTKWAMSDLAGNAARMAAAHGSDAIASFSLVRMLGKKEDATEVVIVITDLFIGSYREVKGKPQWEAGPWGEICLCRLADDRLELHFGAKEVLVIILAGAAVRDCYERVLGVIEQCLAPEELKRLALDGARSVPGGRPMAARMAALLGRGKKPPPGEVRAAVERFMLGRAAALDLGAWAGWELAGAPLLRLLAALPFLRSVEFGLGGRKGDVWREISKCAGVFRHARHLAVCGATPGKKFRAFADQVRLTRIAGLSLVGEVKRDSAPLVGGLVREMELPSLRLVRPLTKGAKPAALLPGLLGPCAASGCSSSRRSRESMSPRLWSGPRGWRCSRSSAADWTSARRSPRSAAWRGSGCCRSTETGASSGRPRTGRRGRS